MKPTSSLLEHVPSAGWLILAGSWRAAAEQMTFFHITLSTNYVSDIDLLCIVEDDPGQDFGHLRAGLEDLTGILCRSHDSSVPLDQLFSDHVPYSPILLLASTSVWSKEAGGLKYVLAAERPDAVVVTAGEYAAAMGTWRISPTGGKCETGLDMLSNALILASEADEGASEVVKNFLAAGQKRYVLHLPPGALIAFGPDGQIRVEGDPPPRITFGSGWTNA